MNSEFDLLVENQNTFYQRISQLTKSVEEVKNFESGRSEAFQSLVNKITKTTTTPTILFDTKKRLAKYYLRTQTKLFYRLQQCTLGTKPKRTKEINF